MCSAHFSDRYRTSNRSLEHLSANFEGVSSKHFFEHR